MENPLIHHRVGGQIPIGGIDFPHQTTKQPVVWVCNNEECREGKLTPAGVQPYYKFKADYPTCPKCKRSGYPYVVKRILVHFVVRDPNGQIEGMTGRFSLACEPNRDFIATPTNGEGGSGDPVAVNCPGCLKRILEEGLGIQGMRFRLDPHTTDEVGTKDLVNAD